jgi:hypothetical protein
MNILSRDEQIAAISALTEGCSIRATERLTGIHRDTIMRLGVGVGDGCAALHDEMMRFVQVNRPRRRREPVRRPLQSVPGS